MKTTIVAAVAAASLTVLAPPPAVAQIKQNQSGRATVDIQVCNESGRNASVAVSYVEIGTGRFINRGWYEVYNGACTHIVSTDNANFYMYGDATDGSGRSWSGNHTLCVQYPGPYTFWSTGGEYCDDGQEVKNFVAMTAAEVGTYTWTLEP